MSVDKSPARTHVIVPLSACSSLPCVPAEKPSIFLKSVSIGKLWLQQQMTTGSQWLLERSCSKNTLVGWLSDFFILESWLRMFVALQAPVLFFKALFKAHVINGWNFWCITVRLWGPRQRGPLCQCHRAECPSRWWQPVTSAGHYCCCSVTKSCLTLRPYGLHTASLSRPPCLSPSLGVCPSSCPLNQWCPQPSPLLLPSSSSAVSLSQHQGLFQWFSCLHEVTKVLELQL